MTWVSDGLLRRLFAGGANPTPQPGEGTAHKITDRGRRLSEAVEYARARGGAGRFIAARLSDGRTDGAIYDTRDDAVRHQLHATQCAYLVVPPAPMPPAEATAWLDLHERLYDKGIDLQDPDAANGRALMRMAHETPAVAAGLGLGAPTNRASRRGHRGGIHRVPARRHR